MKFKNILSRFIRSSRSKNKLKIKSDDSYLYSQIIWNSADNLIILLSFTEDYFEQIIELQDAINCSWRRLSGKIIYSSYDEEVSTKDKDGNDINTLLIHKKYYMLIGGEPLSWNELYMHIHDLGNEALSRITDEIINNCDSKNFKELIDDGILNGFTNNYYYDKPILTEQEYYSYTDPEVLLKRLPTGFTGKDILKFITVNNKNIASNALSKIFDIRHRSNNFFYSWDLFPLYNALFKEPTVDKLSMLLEPLYKQPDDDSLPGDVSDESLDEIFKERYERFSAIADDSMYYEDIDEELSDDEEFENTHEGDVTDE